MYVLIARDIDTMRFIRVIKVCETLEEVKSIKMLLENEGLYDYSIFVEDLDEKLLEILKEEA